MRKQDLLLNLLLISSLAGSVWKIRGDWQSYAWKNSPHNLDIHPMNGVSLSPAVTVPNYSSIVQQNPFQADRNDNVEQTAAQAKPAGPPPLIYGSFILGNDRFALMAADQSLKSERVPEGASFGGYHLVKVLPESVILESSAGREEIMLYNALMRLPRQQSKTTAAVSRKSSPADIASGPPVPSGNPTPFPEVPGNRGANPSVPANPFTNPAALPPGKEFMDTPFGPIIVDKKKP